MPIYEYRCEKGHTFEVMQRMTEDPVDACESCGAPARRVFHPVAVHFKGSGFYNTDYGKKSRGSSSTKDEGGEKKKAESSSSADSGASSSSSSASASADD